MVAEKTKVPNQLTLKWGDYPGLSRGPNIITKDPSDG